MKDLNSSGERVDNLHDPFQPDVFRVQPETKSEEITNDLLNRLVFLYGAIGVK